MKRTVDYFVVVSGFILSAALAHVEAEPFHDPMRASLPGGMGAMMFKNMDTNGDGVISKAEFNAFNAKHFKKMDANKDGKLTLGEMQGGHKQEKGHGDGTTHLDERFNAADANHDGGLDKEEAKAMPMLSMYFDEVDANKDGKVTRQEYLDAMPKLHRGKQMDSSGKSQTL